MAEADCNKCSRCNGTGDDGTGFCVSCIGTGYRAGMAVRLYLKKVYDDIYDKVNDIKEKVDETKNKCDEIWDKVKDM